MWIVSTLALLICDQLPDEDSQFSDDNGGKLATASTACVKAGDRLATAVTQKRDLNRCSGRSALKHILKDPQSLLAQPGIDAFLRGIVRRPRCIYIRMGTKIELLTVRLRHSPVSDFN
jgi:hypothetical protein